MTRIKALSKAAQTIFNHLIALANANGGHVKINNSDGVFMPVTVEKINENALGPVYSIAHYYKQNGDLMRDPEITYQVDKNGTYVQAGYAFPTSYTQDNLGIFREFVVLEDNQCVGCFMPYHQHDAAKFTTTWFRNIKQQQGLRPKPMKKTESEIQQAHLRRELRELRKRWRTN